MTDQVTEVAETTETKVAEIDYEAKASELGWVPKEKFKGDPEKHVDAKTYWEKGELVLPIVRQQRDEFKSKLEKTDKELAEMRKAMSDFQKETEAAAERKYKEQIAELRAAKAAAVEAGDKAAYQRADDALEEIKESKPVPVKVETKPEPTGDPEFEAWVKDNDWYVKDAAKRRLANAIGLDLTQENPSLKGSKLFDMVTKEMDRIEAEKSGTERAGPQRGGKTGAPNSKAKNFDNLPAEYKKSFDRQVRMGIKMTKEQFVSKCDPDAWEA